MTKNKMMRIASALLVAVLLSTCAISGTFAKYVTTDTDTDTARVAKWGVDVAVTVDGAFATEYAADANVNDSNSQAITKTVVSSDTDKLLAPGTDGTLLAVATISGTPEVAVNVKKEATLTLTGWEVDDTYYCPLTITVITVKNEQEQEQVFYGLDYNSADAFITAVEGALDSDVNYAPNTDLEASQSVTWAWAFEGDNEKDTALGDAAVDGDDITISFTYTITVTQID